MTRGRILWVPTGLDLYAQAVHSPGCREATREELLGELARSGYLVLDRPLTSADVAAALMADPGLALQVLDQLRLARPWVSDDSSAARADAQQSDPLAEPVGYVFREPQDGRWELEDATAMDRQAEREP